MTGPSVASRALLAVGLMVGFYAMALAISAALIYVPVAEVLYAHHITPRLVIVCLAGAFAILSAIRPRWDRFKAPGPTLEPASHPALFAEIQRVAKGVEQQMPAEVYLVGDVNAWVAQRGGIMGLFSRRVMGLGLPLLQTLTVSELRAVLAHEFGHFFGGDTRLGPWIYKTRSAIGRTIMGLRSSWLQKPFIWYGNLFLRITHAVSRRQELSADALAARVAGSRPLCEGLKKVHTAAQAYNAFWSSEIVPVLQAGFLPPIADGFRQFTSHTNVANAMAAALETGIKQTDVNPYDTHPPLAERLAAVANIPAGCDPTEEPVSISLLSDVPELERKWLATVASTETVAKLERVKWDEVLTQALLPKWREIVRENAAILDRATIGSLARIVCESPESDRRQPDDAKRARWLASAATILALQDAGWSIEALPGDPVLARRSGAEVNPFDVVRRLADGSLSAESWAAEAAELGIDDLPLVG